MTRDAAIHDSRAEELKNLSAHFSMSTVAPKLCP